MNHDSIEPEIPDADGWYCARCSCGWTGPGPFPEIEMVVDVLMEHAFEAALIEQALLS